MIKSFTELEHAAVRSLIQAHPYDPDFNAWFAGIVNDPVSCALFESRVLHRMRSSSPPMDEKIAVNVVANTMHALTAWESSGLPVFRPTEDLWALLKGTAEHDEKSPMPFNGFEIRPPQCALTGMETILVSRKTADTVLPGRPDLPGGAYFTVQIRKTNGNTLNVSQPWESPLDGADNLGDYDAETAADVRSMITIVRRVVCGLCSFVTAKIEPLYAENERAAQRDLASGRAARPRIFVLGKTIKMSQEQRLRYMSPIASGPTWRLEQRLKTLAHWRWQPIGRNVRIHDEEGPRNARLTWIEEFFKGPKGAEAWRHVYEVDLPSPT